MTKSTILPLLAALALGLAGCAGDGPVKTVAEVAGMATTTQEAKVFVQETRPVDPAYVPVQSAITREAPRKTVPDFKKLEADLEAKRISNDAAGSQARELGKKLPPPAPAPVLPTN